MGLEERIPCTEPPPLERVLSQLAADGYASVIAMVDGALVMPKAPPPERWRDVRLRTPDGTVSLVRQDAGVSVVVFGNADDRMRAAQARVLTAIRSALLVG